MSANSLLQHMNPWYVNHTDFIELFRMSSASGCILVTIDKFSKWIELHKFAYVDTKETALALFVHFGRFGALSQIMSDRGSQFVNQVISEILAFVGTEHCLSIAYSKK